MIIMRWDGKMRCVIVSSRRWWVPHFSLFFHPFVGGSFRVRIPHHGFVVGLRDGRMYVEHQHLVHEG